jgi:hypothetical protein
LDHLEFGREIAGGLGNAAHGKLVGRYADGAAFRSAREVGEQPWEETACYAAESKKLIRLEDALKVSHAYWATSI